MTLVSTADLMAVAVHLDHAQDEDLVMQAIELGFGSVRYDGKDGAHHPDARTDPDEAAAFVRATGVDARGRHDQDQRRHAPEPSEAIWRRTHQWWTLEGISEPAGMP
ncbi:MAG TPA: class II fructose-bisphosphate aldolase [Propionibacteriaceae bacterium]|nr:class II fructose-bisphosphate aldolase [Propionibacteriaceae bacterium]